MFCRAYTKLANDATHEKTYRLVQLFAYGTLKDYTDCELSGSLELTTAPDSFPALTPAHQNKLKHLTLLSLALANRVRRIMLTHLSFGVIVLSELTARAFPTRS